MASFSLTTSQDLLLRTLAGAGPMYLERIHHEYHQDLVALSLTDPPLIVSIDNRVTVTDEGLLVIQAGEVNG